jgi:ribosomal protein S18 acetylase RimI-like enzyme
MRSVKDWDDYRKCVAEIPRLTPAYTTNLYAAQENLERWCKSGRLNVIEADGVTLFLLADHDFHHVYHVAEAPDKLTLALATLPVGTYVTDLVGERDVIDLLCATYAKAGFARYTFLCRMSMNQLLPVAQLGSESAVTAPDVASIDDVPEIAALLKRLLDRFSEKLPEIAELEQSAKLGQLLFVRRGQAIAGVLMYEVKGQLAHLRLWHVDATARGAGIGRTLMAEFFARTAEVRRRVLWVIGDNTRSIEIYRHYGFIEDGLIDQIMILRKESI